MPDTFTIQPGSVESISTLIWLDWLVRLVVLVLIFVIAFKVLALLTRLTDRVAPHGPATSTPPNRTLTAARFVPIDVWAPQHSMTTDQAIEQIKAGHLKGFTSDGRWYVLLD